MRKLKLDKGVAGLNVLLSVITMLFVIGLLVMIFALMGGEMRDAVEQDVANNETAVTVINDTTTSISGVTSWFTIIIVITAMVVLILLTVIIISSIRSSGLMASA